MPQFSYDALDSTGKTVRGTLDAATENELIVRLSSQGLRVQRFTRGQSAPPQPQRPVPSTIPVQPQVHTPVPPVAVSSPAAKPNLSLRPSTESELYFFLMQLANLLRSGIAPTEALATIASRHRNADQAQAFRHMAQRTAKGATLADSMADFDALFPPGVIGAVRAGESGGYTWEACQMVAEQVNSSMKLRRVAMWFSFMFWSSVLSLPILGVAAEGIDKMVQSIENGRAALPELMRGLGAGLVGPWGWVTVIGTALFFFLNWYLRKPQFRELRHNFSMRVPILRKRAEGENIEAFNAHLSRLGRAGISPYTSWKLAAAAVPNQAFAEKLAYAGSSMNENTRLSQVMYATRVFPQEFGPLVENGEVTGNLPQALQQAAEVGRAQAKQAEVGLKWRMGCWVGLVMLLFSSLFFAVPYRALYESLFKHVVSESESQ